MLVSAEVVTVIAMPLFSENSGSDEWVGFVRFPVAVCLTAFNEFIMQICLAKGHLYVLHLLLLSKLGKKCGWSHNSNKEYNPGNKLNKNVIGRTFRSIDTLSHTDTLSNHPRWNDSYGSYAGCRLKAAKRFGHERTIFYFFCLEITWSQHIPQLSLILW